MSVRYEIADHVAVLTLDSGENRFNPDFIDDYLAALDEIENRTDARTLVVTSAHPKIFSNGIDLEWLYPLIQEGKAEVTKAFFYRLNQMLKRTLTYPLLTVAAMNGHAFAGGAIWACGFDFRFMRSERGFFCFPEVDLNVPFLPGMLGLLRKAIPAQVMEKMIYTGVRLTADQCVEYEIVQAACPGENLMATTMAFAQGLKKERAFIREMRYRLYKDILQALDVEDVAFIEGGRFNVA